MPNVSHSYCRNKMFIELAEKLGIFLAISLVRLAPVPPAIPQLVRVRALPRSDLKNLKKLSFFGFFRILIRQRTWENLIQIDFEINLLENFFKTMNSYLGMLTQVNGFIIRKDLCLNIINLFLGCDNLFSKLILN